MPQKQYTTYQAEVLSFELRDALLGIIKPGRYTGFNVMTEYQAKSGDNVYCRINHTAGINKYNKAIPPVLDSLRGVAVTTQGTIIAEDANVDVTVVLSNPATTHKWLVLYMEHEYVEIEGANDAIFALRVGTEDGGIPSLLSPTKQIVIGYIYQPSGATAFANLKYYPASAISGFGDAEIGKKLFGKDWEDISSGGNMGPIPAEKGIIGNRVYEEDNYIIDDESLTDSLNKLDKALNSEVVTLGNKRLDEWATPQDNTNLNATSTYHGLLPKLSGDATDFLTGSGTWMKTYGIRVRRSANQTITQNTWTKWTFNVVMFGLTSMLPEAGRIVIPETGYYLVMFIGQIQSLGDTYLFNARINLNGVNNFLETSGGSNGSIASKSINASIIAFLEVDDYLEVEIYHTDPVDKSFSGGSTGAQSSLSLMRVF